MYKLSDHLIARVINNKMIIINKEEPDNILIFDNSSKIFLESIINNCNQDKICDRIIKAYKKIAYETILNDYKLFINELIDNKIIMEDCNNG